MNKLSLVNLLLALSCVTSNLAAQDFTDLYIFGDSLSDTGNDHIASNGQVPLSPPYYEGRFTNGPVWAEHLAEGLGLPTPVPSLAGGNNFAFGGAQTGPGISTIAPFPNVGTQIDMFLATGKQFGSNDLVVLWAGHNDITGEIANGLIAANIVSHVNTLVANGAETVLVGNMFNAPQLNTLIAADVNRLNSDLAAEVQLFDFNAVANQILASPASFGLTNATGQACDVCTVGDKGGTVADNPNDYVLWDEIHPTAAVHQIVGQRALETVRSIPEPSSLLVLMAGLLPVLRFRRGLVR